MEKDKPIIPTFAKVVIIGGGPAGIATALSLRQRGVPFLVIEASAVVSNKIGETLPPNCKPILKLLAIEDLVENASHLPSYGNKYLWGSSQEQAHHFLFQKYGHGWQLKRKYFEQQLIEKMNKGQLLQGAKLLGVQQNSDAGWELDVIFKNQKYSIHCDFVVDASGRAAKFTRLIGCKRDQLDNLVGLACRFRVSNPGAIPNFTHVESVENGWWYAALLSTKELVVVFMTDADLVDKKMLGVGGFWDELAKTQLISGLFPRGYSLYKTEKIQTKSANTSCLGQVFGQNWLAVGDAAFAYDPISSFGMSSALGSGFYAGQAIADHFSEKSEALPAYRQITEQAFIHYLKGWQHQYMLEQRWSSQVFWQRRHNST